MQLQPFPKYSVKVVNVPRTRKKFLWANIANAWLPMPEQRELYLHTETENQNFVFNIFLVLTHSACPYKNCGIKYFVDP